MTDSLMSWVIHDVAHCVDYDENECPESCWRGRVTKELLEDVELQKHPHTWAHFLCTNECSRGGEEEVTDKASQLHFSGESVNDLNLSQTFECPDWVVSLLEDIEKHISRLHYNRTQETWISAFRNTGASYIGNDFEVYAYNWGAEELPYNFRWKSIELSWYKHLGRNTTININPRDELFSQRITAMYNAIIDELKHTYPDEW